MLWNLSTCFPKLKIILQSGPFVFKFNLKRTVIFFFFFAQEVFAFASTASRASRYHLASFEPDFFTNPASKHLLGFAQTRYSAQNCAGYTFPLIPNKQIFLEKNLFYENWRWFIQYCIKPELSLPVLKVPQPETADRHHQPDAGWDTAPTRYRSCPHLWPPIGNVRSGFLHWGQLPEGERAGKAGTHETFNRIKRKHQNTKIAGWKNTRL